jgi:hypothetical protein
MAKEKTHDEQMDEMNAGIATLHEEIASIAAGLKKFTDRKNGRISVDPENPSSDASDSDAHADGRTHFRHKLNEAGARGKKITESIADEIERHPLIGGLFTFGLGYIIARLLFKRKKRNVDQ